MPWSSIAFAQGFDSAQCRWIRTAFQQITFSASDRDFDALALYRSRATGAEATIFLSPLGTERMRAAMPGLDLVDCDRPSQEDVYLVIGVPLATDPTWCELSPAERLAEAEAAYSTIELVPFDVPQREVS